MLLRSWSGIYVRSSTFSNHLLSRDSMTLWTHAHVDRQSAIDHCFAASQLSISDLTYAKRDCEMASPHTAQAHNLAISYYPKQLSSSIECGTFSSARPSPFASHGHCTMRKAHKECRCQSMTLTLNTLFRLLAKPLKMHAISQNCERLNFWIRFVCLRAHGHMENSMHFHFTLWWANEKKKYIYE